MLYNLVIARKKKKKSQKQIAEELGWSEDKYRRKETGETKFTVMEAIKVMDILDISYAEIKKTFQGEE